MSVGLAVCGLHLTGQPLNSQLVKLGATLARSCKSAPCYRMYAISSPNKPTKPGMIKVLDGSGVSVQLEVWDIELEKLGFVVNQIAPPLGIGTIDLEDGSTTLGFICEGYVAQCGEGIQDITQDSQGSWLQWLSRRG